MVGPVHSSRDFGLGAYPSGSRALNLARRWQVLGRMAVQPAPSELHSRKIAPWCGRMNPSGFFWQFLVGVGHGRCQSPNYVFEQTVGRDRGVF